jgi:hypothetical protein
MITLCNHVKTYKALKNEYVIRCSFGCCESIFPIIGIDDKATLNNLLYIREIVNMFKDTTAGVQHRRTRHYCLLYRRIQNIRVKMSPIEKEKRNKKQRQYCKNNPTKIAENSKRTYLRQKEEGITVQRARQYYNDNKRTLLLRQSLNLQKKLKGAKKGEAFFLALCIKNRNITDFKLITKTKGRIYVKKEET